MAKTTKGHFTLAAPGCEPAEVDGYEVVRDPGARTAFVVRGIDRTGKIRRFPIPGATVNGKAVDEPTPDEQRAAAPEAPNATKAAARAAGEAGGPATAQPSRPPGPANPPRGKRPDVG